MSHRRLTAALSTTLMLVLALSSATAAQSGSSKAAAKAQEKAERDRIVRYWTPARMAKAKPREFVKTRRGFVPAAKGGNKPTRPPKGPGGDDGSTGAVTGAPWTGGGPVLTGTGKVFFTMNGTNYVCSGATVDDKGRSGYSLVLTAGHCAFDETRGEFAENWLFAPEYDTSPSGCAGAVHGCFTAVALVVHSGYATAGGFNGQAIKHDWAFAVVGAGSKGGQLDGRVADFPMAFSANSEERHSFGYPAAGKYDGRDLIYCAGPVSTDSRYDTWGLRCDMTPGSSGGPWFRDFDGARQLNSVNSYRYSGGKLKSYLFGPKFGPRTKAVYDRSLTVTADTRVD